MEKLIYQPFSYNAYDIDEAILLSNRILILSGLPGKITHEINTIEEKHPRVNDLI